MGKKTVDNYGALQNVGDKKHKLYSQADLRCSPELKASHSPATGYGIFVNKAGSLMHIYTNEGTLLRPRAKGGEVFSDPRYALEQARRYIVNFAANMSLEDKRKFLSSLPASERKALLEMLKETASPKKR